MVVEPFDVLSFINFQGIPRGQKKQLKPTREERHWNLSRLSISPPAVTSAVQPAAPGQWSEAVTRAGGGMNGIWGGRASILSGRSSAFRSGRVKANSLTWSNQDHSLVPLDSFPIANLQEGNYSGVNPWSLKMNLEIPSFWPPAFQQLNRELKVWPLARIPDQRRGREQHWPGLRELGFSELHHSQLGAPA